MKLSIIIILSLLLVSCKQKEEKNPLPLTETIEQEKPAEETHESINAEISLNNGELWQANPETTEGILKMKERMNSFNDFVKKEAYTILKVGLETDFTELFQKCTMKGEAHNQLHNYLFPFIDLFDGLESSDLEICKKSFKELNIHLEEYPNYFQ